MTSGQMHFGHIVHLAPVSEAFRGLAKRALHDESSVTARTFHPGALLGADGRQDFLARHDLRGTSACIRVTFVRVTSVVRYSSPS